MIDPQISTDLWAEWYNAVTREIVRLRRKYRVPDKRITLRVCPARFPNEVHISVGGVRKSRVRLVQDTETPALYICTEDW